MRSISTSAYSVTYPNAVAYSRAGNYISVSNLATSGMVELAVTANGKTYTLQRVGDSVVFPLDGIFSAIVANNDAPRLVSVSWSLTLPDGTQVASTTYQRVALLRGAQPDGTEIPNTLPESGFYNIGLLFAYPTGAVYALVYATTSMYVSGSDVTQWSAAVPQGWSIIAVPSGAVSASSPYIRLTETPDSMAGPTAYVVVDNCAEGWLVNWLDASGLRRWYRFPKGLRERETRTTRNYYTFDDLLRPQARVERTSTTSIEVSTEWIRSAERDYVAGLQMGTDVSVLDLAAWDKDPTTQPTHAIVQDMAVALGGQPLQRIAYTLTYENPTL